jgi:hypothetical protein
VARRAIQDVRELAHAHDALRERLADHPPQLLRRQVGGEVEHGTRGRCDEDVVAAPDVAPVERASAVWADTGQGSSRAAALGDHIDVAGRPRTHLVPRGGAVAGENGVVATREGGRRQPPAEAERAGTHCVDAAMDPVQLASLHPHGDRAAVQPTPLQLANRHDVVLLGGKPRDRQIGSVGEFRRLSLCRSPHERIVALIA